MESTSREVKVSRRITQLSLSKSSALAQPNPTIRSLSPAMSAGPTRGTVATIAAGRGSGG